MMTKETVKECLHCQLPFKAGRVDKKYCDGYCRTSYNNKIKKNAPKLVKVINLSLMQNRNVLEKIFLQKKGNCKVHENVLKELGYDHRYFTHYTYDNSGNQFKCCYDFGMKPLKNDYFWVFKKWS